MRDREAVASWIASPSLRLFVALPALQTSNSTSLDGVWLCDSHRESPNTTTTPEIDGQLKSERRRLERVICENSSNMQNEFSLHLPRARKGEREGGKKASFLSISDLSQLDKEARRENKTAA